MEKAISHDLTLSLASLTDATLASRIAAHVGTRARAHLMVDTGLSRGGFHPAELREALPELCRLRGLDITGIWGHFAAIEPLEEARNTIRGFQELVAHAQRFCSLRFVHMASSGAIASLPESHFTVVRPGLALYGYLPCRRNGTALVPAMRVTAPVVSVKRYPAGATVSYEGTYVLERSSKVATIRFGYADGYDFHLGNAGEVAIEGARYPIVGRVTMDQMMAAVGDAPVVPGHRAVLMGPPGPSPVELAAQGGTIPYAILIGLGKRVRKAYRRGGAEAAWGVAQSDSAGAERRSRRSTANETTIPDKSSMTTETDTPLSVRVLS